MNKLAKVNRFIQTGISTFDPNALKPEENKTDWGMFFGHLYYEWETKIGEFKTGLFFWIIRIIRQNLILENGSLLQTRIIKTTQSRANILLPFYFWI